MLLLNSYILKLVLVMKRTCFPNFAKKCEINTPPVNNRFIFFRLVKYTSIIRSGIYYLLLQLNYIIEHVDATVTFLKQNV